MKASVVGHVSLAMVLLAAAHPLAAPAAAGCLGPSALIASKDGKSLFVANADAKQIAVVDVAARKVVGSIPLPAEPTGLALSADGGKLYATCAAPKGAVCVIDAASRKVVAALPADYGATGVAATPDGKQLYVCNRFHNDVSVIDLANGREVARVKATREPVGVAITPDGKTAFVINLLPLAPSDSYDVAANVTAIDTATKQPAAIRLPNGSSSVRGICTSPDGRYVYVVHILAHYQMPDDAGGARLDEHQCDDDHRRFGAESDQYGALGRRGPRRGQSLGSDDHGGRQEDSRDALRHARAERDRRGGDAGEVGADRRGGKGAGASREGRRKGEEGAARGRRLRRFGGDGARRRPQ